MSEEIKVYNTQEVDLEQMLAEFGSGMRLSISRIEPLWCDGHLATLELDDGESFSIERLRDLFGGRKLLVKVLDPDGKIITRRNVRFPDSPRKDGRILRQPDEEGGNQGKDLTLMNFMIDSQSKQNEAMMKLVVEQSKANQQLLQERIEEQKTAHQQLSSTQSSLKETLELMTFVEEIKERLGSGDGKETENPLYERFLHMGEKFLTMKMARDQQQVEHVSRQAEAPELPTRKPVNEAPKMTLQNVEEEDLLNHVAKRFAGMSLEQQQQTLGTILEKIPSFTEKMQSTTESGGSGADSLLESEDISEKEGKTNDLEIDPKLLKPIKVSLSAEDERELASYQGDPAAPTPST